MHKIFNLILIFSAVVTAWTSIVLFSNTTFNSEINEVRKKMYINQKEFINNVKDLSILLLKDANMRIYDKNNDLHKSLYKTSVFIISNNN